MEYFIRTEIEGSYRARELQHLLGFPSYQQLINTLSKNLIMNRPFLLDDVRRAMPFTGQLLLFWRGNCEEESQTCWVQTTHSHWSRNSKATSIANTPYGFLLYQQTPIFHHNHREGELQDNHSMPRPRQERDHEEATSHSCPEHQEGFPGKWISCG